MISLRGRSSDTTQKGWRRRHAMKIAIALVLAVPGFASAQEELLCVADETGSLPAECESFSFEIEITSVTETNGVLDGILSGDQLAGTFTVNTGVQDVDPTANEGRFLNAVECVSLDMGGRIFTADLTPVEITIPPSSSDPGIATINDSLQSAPGVSIYADTATFGMGGLSMMNIVGTPDPTDFVFGGGGFAFSYGDTCFIPGPFPCPPSLLVDDGIPGATGDLTGILGAALMSCDFSSLGGDFGTAQADLLQIVAAPVVPCPEPGLALGAAVGVLGLAAGRRETRHSQRTRNP